MENSGITWTDNTFNAWIGCTKVSAGCKNCYAEADMDNRRGRVQWGINGTRSVTSYAYWRNPYKWNADAEKEGKRIKVFCSSLADVFEDWIGQVQDSKHRPLWWNANSYDVDNVPVFAIEKNIKQNEDASWLNLNILRDELFDMIERTPNLDWQLLTKRPENIMSMVPKRWQKKFPENVWIGTSVEDKLAAKDRIGHLLQIPAKVRFLSMEPLLEEVDPFQTFSLDGKKLNWVIVGGESGSNKRPFETDWARIIRDRCETNKVAFFMKQVDKVRAIPEDLQVQQFPKHFNF